MNIFAIPQKLPPNNLPPLLHITFSIFNHYHSFSSGINNAKKKIIRTTHFIISIHNPLTAFTAIAKHRRHHLRKTNTTPLKSQLLTFYAPRVYQSFVKYPK